MNKKSILALLSFLSLSSVAPAQNYQLVWSDEFDDNTLGVNWNVETVEHPSNNELQYYTGRPSNVTIADGNLIIKARREAYGNRAFTSGRVNSCQRVGFKHGKIEARIRMPRLARGLWPAFWMMGDDIQTVGWPACGEIDIMEAGHSDGMKNNTTERLFSGCIHWGPSIPQHQQWTTGAVTADVPITGGYHLFTAVWDDNYIRCYLDNAPQPYYEATITPEMGSSPYFHKPFHILFNLAVGGDYPAIYNAGGITALPYAGSEAEMRVDYVRVYQEMGKQNVSYVQNDQGGDMTGIHTNKVYSPENSSKGASVDDSGYRAKFPRSCSLSGMVLPTTGVSRGIVIIDGKKCLK